MQKKKTSQLKKPQLKGPKVCFKTSTNKWLNVLNNKFNNKAIEAKASLLKMNFPWKLKKIKQYSNRPYQIQISNSTQTHSPKHPNPQNVANTKPY